LLWISGYLHRHTGESGHHAGLHWRVNGILKPLENNPLFSYTPVNGDVVTATMASNATYCISGNPAVSNSVALVVNAEKPVSLFIQASENPFCAGSQVTYTALPTNGGSSPAYQWKKTALK